MNLEEDAGMIELKPDKPFSDMTGKCAELNCKIREPHLHLIDERPLPFTADADPIVRLSSERSAIKPKPMSAERRAALTRNIDEWERCGDVATVYATMADMGDALAEAAYWREVVRNANLGLFSCPFCGQNGVRRDADHERGTIRTVLSHAPDCPWVLAQA